MLSGSFAQRVVGSGRVGGNNFKEILGNVLSQLLSGHSAVA